MTRRTWVVLPDQLSIRVFFDTGIVSGLRERLDGCLAAVFLVSPARQRRIGPSGCQASPRTERSSLRPMGSATERWRGSTQRSTARSGTTRSRSV